MIPIELPFPGYKHWTNKTHSARSVRFQLLALAGSIALATNAVSVAQAQTQKRSSTAVLMEEVVVSARKRQENSQDVPIAISAYGKDQLDALKVRNLESLSVGLPNVALDDAGTARGYANFAIRGLGINSSILSIDPSVGLFVDGVYMGISAGLVFDVFDLESVEVLRGPQGTLFGRNVTGGAILMNTKKPGDEFAGSARVAVDGGGDGGLNKYVMGTVGGPLSDTFRAKVTAYYNDDDGWFENKYDGEDFGAIEQEMYRAIGVWTPADGTEIIMRVEHGETESDGPAAQSHTNGDDVDGSPNSWDRDSHDFSIDETGYYNTESDFVTLEINQDVDFGNGTITNITGWRTYDAESLGDIDGQPLWLFHSYSWTEQEQFSNELRFSGRFADRASVTTGLYYFKQDIDYAERRELLGYLPVVPTLIPPYLRYDGGGEYSVETWAVFGAVDYDLTSELILNLGLRYSYEEKEAKVASLADNISGFAAGNTPGCQVISAAPSGNPCFFRPIPEDDKDWTNWSPKVGLTYLLSENSRVYAHWTRSFRSGGYNLRNSVDPSDPIPAPYDQLNAAEIPGPFDEETVDNYEIGFKSEYGRSRFNAALFYTEIEDMQRELNFTGSIGSAQLVRNTADAEILGIEVDGAYAILDNLLVFASVGWLDAEYSEVRADLNGDGNIDSSDEDLDLPRAAELTYSVGLNHDLSLGSWGYMATRISYAYRDEAAYTDDNKGYLLDQEILDAGIDFHTNDESWVFGIYGKNLLNDVKHGGDTQLPSTVGGGTFAPLAKGKVIGAEVTYNF